MLYYYLILIWIIIIQITRKNSIFRTREVSIFLLILMFIMMIFVVFLKPISGDMERYLEIFNINSMLSLNESLVLVRWEPGFVIYQWLLSKLTTSPYIFIGVSMIIMWSILIKSLKKIIEVIDIPLIMFGYLSFFYFYNFSTNVIRQGIAAPLILLMLIYIDRKKLKKAILTLTVAMLFHSSAIVAVVLIFIKKLKLSIRFITFIYIISAVLMITDINRILMTSLVGIVGINISDTIINYSSEAKISKYGSTNRFDFLIFTTMWIFWGLGIQKLYLKDDKFYEWLLKSYISLSSVYILFAFIAYSDRIAAYGWFLIPIILFYPVIKMKSNYRYVWLVISILISLALFYFFGVSELYEPLKLFY